MSAFSTSESPAVEPLCNRLGLGGRSTVESGDENRFISPLPQLSLLLPASRLAFLSALDL